LVELFDRDFAMGSPDGYGAAAKNVELKRRQKLSRRNPPPCDPNSRLRQPLLGSHLFVS
jgi:hypothetical protein